MQDKIFRTFREAADYARKESEKSGLTMNVVRTGDSWKVAGGSSLQSESHIHKKSDGHAWHKKPNLADAVGRRVPEGAHYSWETGSYVSDEIERVSIQRQRDKERRLESRIAAIGPSAHNDHRRLLEEAYRRFSEMSDGELAESWEKIRSQSDEELPEEARALRAVVRKRWGISTPEAKEIEVCARCYQPRSQCACDPAR
jgi:hypothetical protein